MILLSLLSCLVPLALGFLLISIVWPARAPSAFTTSLKLCLSVGIGFGMLSCTYFLQLVFLGPSRRTLVLIEALLFMALIVFFFYKRRTAKRVLLIQDVQEPTAESRVRSILSILFVVAFVSTAVTFIFISLKNPNGDWDAWAVYNMKARFLFRAGVHWRDLFAQPMEWASLDYPLIIPTAIAACWTLIGKETLIVPALVAMLFTLATAGIVTSSVAILRGRTSGLLAGLIMLSTPYFINHGASQYSDIPIGFFFIATIALLTLQDSVSRDDSKLLVLAGVTASLACWTKNEGNLFLIAVLTARFAVIVPRSGLKSYLRQMRFFAAGLLPVLLIVIYFKLTISAHSFLLAPPEGPNFIAKLTDFSRYRMALDHLLRLGLGYGNWPFSIVPALIFYLLLVGIKIGRKEKVSVGGSFIALGIMLTGYFMIYVISPLDLEWHLITSVERLYSQLWPSFIFLFFMLVRSPEQALAGQEIPADAEEAQEQPAAL